jgi:hypothetical protein
MNSLELAYTVTLLRRLSESADHYIDDGTWLEDLTTDIKQAKQLIKVYDERLIKQAQKEAFYAPASDNV